MAGPVVFPVGVLVIALAGAGIRTTEAMMATINANAVNVANTISAGDPRQNPPLGRGCVAAAVKYDDGGAGAVELTSAGSGASGSAAMTGFEAMGFTVTDSGGVEAGATGSGVVDGGCFGVSTLCWVMMTLSLVYRHNAIVREVRD